MTLDSKIIIPDSLFLQQVDDETILLDTNTQEYFALNELGTLIWDVLSFRQDLNAVKDAVLEKYDVDESTAQKDILAFMEMLLEKKLISLG